MGTKKKLILNKLWIPQVIQFSSARAAIWKRWPVEQVVANAIRSNTKSHPDVQTWTRTVKARPNDLIISAMCGWLVYSNENLLFFLHRGGLHKLCCLFGAWSSLNNQSSPSIFEVQPLRQYYLRVKVRTQTPSVTKWRLHFRLSFLYVAKSSAHGLDAFHLFIM